MSGFTILGIPYWGPYDTGIHLGGALILVNPPFVVLILRVGNLLRVDPEMARGEK